jgi:predicted CxxxxCH...CXXCH cytochrome family protein
VRRATPSRSTLRAVAILTAGLLSACGSARKVEGAQADCQRCHGDAARQVASSNALAKSAPPMSVRGATATTDIAVGAHQAHVIAGRLRGPISCSECHVVPADMAAHEAEIARIAAGTAQRVTFGALAAKDATAAAWDRATATCSGTYCHGATLDQGGFNHTPLWTGNISQATCTSCHGFPPSAALGHPSPAPDCSACHSATVDTDNSTIKIAADGSSTHIDGHLTVDGLTCSGTCTTCHGAPPATGAHLAHVTTTPTTYGLDTRTADTLTTSATTYDFGCGNCHPTDCAQHAVGGVVLSPATATVGSLKERNVAPSYDPVTKTCDGVYCHSSGQATPTFVRSPGWGSGTTLGCAGCHANPPAYANGGAGAATANSHVGLIDELGLTYETGHFGGFPAAFHDGSYHGVGGGKDSSPITCQTCHFDTADATNTGAPGFYYLDTTGSYDLGGTGGFTLGGVAVAAYACTACHDGTPPAQGGKAKPYFHVNGTRDVAFDRRTALTGTPTLPAAPNTPTRPYWLTSTNDLTWVATAVGASGGLDGTTVSFALTAATWNATDKTCAGVACHFNRTSAQWGEPLSANPTTGTCTVCHNQ